jgi:hypothetical protein
VAQRNRSGLKETVRLLLAKFLLLAPAKMAKYLSDEKQLGEKYRISK